jgi:hypothetical protein
MENREKDKKNTNILISILIIFLILGVIFIIRYFMKGPSNKIALPRLTLDLYDDIDAYMQYDY